MLARGPGIRATRGESIGGNKRFPRVRALLPQGERAYEKPISRPYREADLKGVPEGWPAQTMKARAPYGFEHGALMPGPGNAEHFPLFFPTWPRVRLVQKYIDIIFPFKYNPP